MPHNLSKILTTLANRACVCGLTRRSSSFGEQQSFLHSSDPSLSLAKTPEERVRLISFTRKTLDAEPGLVDVPIVAGVGGASTRESVALARDAARAGA